MIDSITSATIAGIDAGTSSPGIDALIERNSNRFGVDPHSLAADLGDLSAAARLQTLGDLSSKLTPMQQGELLRALDTQAAAPKGPASQTTKAGAAAGHATPLGLDKLLGVDPTGLIAKSPTLTRQLAALEKAGWHVQLGAAGGGTYADRTTKTITIDRAEAGHPADLVQSLAHEVGHASYGNTSMARHAPRLSKPRSPTRARRPSTTSASSARSRRMVGRTSASRATQQMRKLTTPPTTSICTFITPGRRATRSERSMARASGRPTRTSLMRTITDRPTTPRIRTRHTRAFGFRVLVAIAATIGCAKAGAVTPIEPMTHLVRQFVQEPPASRAVVERIIGVALTPGAASEVFASYTAHDIDALGLKIASVEYREPAPGAGASDGPLLTLGLPGSPCYEPDFVRTHVGQIALSESPSPHAAPSAGRFYFTRNEPWGRLSFGFQAVDMRPKCLMTVVFAVAQSPQ